ncbi:rhoGAP domain-containing protein [Naegleria gruberi]|uniref:RhoGAP domain-containing protein n=1 Tax=Naegleria gruberi TaxID=5762 RepID=D2VKT8_NAEGR|nr:rhoGAP domain-containing protein [Naegleria gruberi]EFC42427.1 rhoGAP domain-containing protein [Naegleria gruberi]|eukprot:XP_002675171.1 rhoGAP domain-containing protein [Naegleria gruberi strain NEG-M]
MSSSNDEEPTITTTHVEEQQSSSSDNSDGSSVAAIVATTSVDATITTSPANSIVVVEAKQKATTPTPSTPQHPPPQHHSTPSDSTSSIGTPVITSAVIESDDGLWVTVYDPTTKRNYYHNKTTNETTWSLPMNLSSPNLGAHLRSQSSIGEEIQRVVSTSTPSATPKTPGGNHEALVPQSEKVDRTRHSGGHQRSLSQDGTVSNLKSRVSHLHSIPINVKKELDNNDPPIIAMSMDDRSGLFTRSQANSDDEETPITIEENPTPRQLDHGQIVFATTPNVVAEPPKTTPVTTPSASNEGELEDGWEATIDPSTGRTYYFHRQTQKSSWDRPVKKSGASVATVSTATVSTPVAAASTTISTPSESHEPESDLLPRIAPGDHTLLKYGKANFQKIKKGFFKTSVKVEKLIEFSKDRLNQTLHPIKLEQHQEKALRCFELIQLFMGDRNLEKCSPTVKQIVKSGTNVHDFFLSKEILQIALLNVPIRNEIVIYLCKQTNNHAKIENALKGVQLLGLMLSAFPPTTYDLQEAVLYYLQKTLVTHPKIGRDDRIRQFSLLCEKHLRRSCVTGPRKTLPSDNEIKNMSNPNPPEPIFGVSISEYWRWQKDKFPNGDQAKPFILNLLSEALKKTNLYTVEGIFRLPGDVSRVEGLKEKLCKSNFEINEKDPHVCASLFKLWLRELADPLIPHRLYEHCVSVANDEKQSAAVLDQLPAGNRAILVFVLDFLSDMLPHSKKTMMTSENLAVVFCPNILRSQSSDPMAIMRNAASEKQFVRNLILHCAHQKGIAEK